MGIMPKTKIVYLALESYAPFSSSMHYTTCLVLTVYSPMPNWVEFIDASIQHMSVHDSNHVYIEKCSDELKKACEILGKQPLDMTLVEGLKSMDVLPTDIKI